MSAVCYVEGGQDLEGNCAVKGNTSVAFQVVIWRGFLKSTPDPHRGKVSSVPLQERGVVGTGEVTMLSTFGVSVIWSLRS
jgi:hypothetical protein